MATKNLDQYEDLQVGMQVEVLADSPHGMYDEGDEGYIESILEHDNGVRIYVVLDGTDEATEIPYSDLCEM